MSQSQDERLVTDFFIKLKACGMLANGKYVADSVSESHPARLRSGLEIAYLFIFSNAIKLFHHTVDSLHVLSLFLLELSTLAKRNETTI